MRNVIFTGGWAHPFERTAPVLASVLDVANIESDIGDDLDALGRALDSGAFDLLTVYACRFQMLDARYSDEQRRTYARTVPIEVREAIAAHVARGGGVLALHTATICFDDWPGWQELLGGGWVWGRSFHPELGEVTVVPTGRHPVVRGLETFTVADEHYHHLDVDGRAVVLAVAPDGDMDHPIVWTHGDRVLVDALGHDERSLTHPTHAALLQRAARWLSGERELVP